MPVCMYDKNTVPLLEVKLCKLEFIYKMYAVYSNLLGSDFPTALRRGEIYLFSSLEAFNNIRTTNIPSSSENAASPL